MDRRSYQLLIVILALLLALPALMPAWSGVVQAQAGVGAWAPMPTARHHIGLAAASNGKLYAVGGSTSGNSGVTALRTVEEYNPATNTWATRAPMPTGRYGLALAAASNGKLYAVGGRNSVNSYLSTVEEYDPASDSWASRASMSTALTSLGLAGASNGKLYAVGGINSSGTVATVAEYDPAANTWVTRLSMPTARFGLGLTGASNGKLYAVGGSNGTPLATVEEYNPATNTWAARAPMPSAHYYPGLTAASNGKLYAVGGYNGGYLATLEEYDPAANSWVTRPSMTTARWALGFAAASNGKLYAIGGSNGANISAVEAYDPAANAWVFPPTPTPTSIPTATSTAAATATSTVAATATSTAAATATSTATVIPTATATPSDSVSGMVIPGGTTSTGSTASPSDPIESSVTSPQGGAISITEMSVATQSLPSGFQVFGQQVNITAPTATTANPLVMVFRLDSSIVPSGQNAQTIEIFRNGVLVPACTGSVGVASPDPCVSQRSKIAGNDLQITVLTSAASAWNFGVSTGSPQNLPTSTDECKKGGWQNFGGLFKNQGDCVSYVATGGKNPPSGP